MKKKDKGFAIPLTLGVGLTLSIVGLTMTIKATAQKIDTEFQAQKSNAKALAEAGLNRGMSELIKNPEYISVSDCNSDGTPTPTKITLINDSAITAEFSREENTGTLNSRGEYKTAASHLQTTFNIISQPITNTLNLPGIWAENISGSGIIYSNVKQAGECRSPIPNSISHLPLEDPDISLPAGNNTPPLSNKLGVTLSGSDLPILPEFSLPEEANIIESCGRRTLTLPRPDDNPSLPYILEDSSCELAYEDEDRIEIWRDGDITLSGNRRSSQNNITLHVNGDIDLRGTSAIGGYDTAVFVYGEQTISQNGTADFYGFLLAPESHFETIGTSKFAGALWAKSADLGNNTQGKIFQNINQSILDYLPEGTQNLPNSERITSIISYKELPF